VANISAQPTLIWIIVNDSPSDILAALENWCTCLVQIPINWALNIFHIKMQQKMVNEK